MTENENTRSYRQGIQQERERIIKILATMRDTTHEDAWDTLDDVIDAINGVSQNYDINPVSGNPDNKGKPDFPFEYEGWN